MVSKLVEATSIRLSGQYAVVAAVLSTPDRIHMTTEELGDIFEYLNLQDLMVKPWLLHRLYATSAAYAGYNKGLCMNYMDAYACDREEWYMPSRKVLHVDLNSETLTGTVKTLQSVYVPDADVSFVDTRLGYKFKNDQDPLTGRIDDGIYWTAVSKRIHELVQPLIGGWRSPTTRGNGNLSSLSRLLEGLQRLQSVCRKGPCNVRKVMSVGGRGRGFMERDSLWILTIHMIIRGTTKSS